MQRLASSIHIELELAHGSRNTSHQTVAWLLRTLVPPHGGVESKSSFPLRSPSSSHAQCGVSHVLMFDRTIASLSLDAELFLADIHHRPAGLTDTSFVCVCGHFPFHCRGRILQGFSIRASVTVVLLVVTNAILWNCTGRASIPMLRLSRLKFRNVFCRYWLGKIWT